MPPGPATQHPTGQPSIDPFRRQGGWGQELGMFSRSHKVRAPLKGAGTNPAPQALLTLASQNLAK